MNSKLALVEYICVSHNFLMEYLLLKQVIFWNKKQKHQIFALFSKWCDSQVGESTVSVLVWLWIIEHNQLRSQLHSKWISVDVLVRISCSW